MMHVLLEETRRISIARRAVVLPLGFLEQICRGTVRWKCHKADMSIMTLVGTLSKYVQQ